MQINSNTLVVFGKRLMLLMQEKKVTQAQLAKEFSVSQAAVSKWQRGTVPNGETLVRLAMFFAVTPESLVGLEVSSGRSRTTAKSSSNVADQKLKDYEKTLHGLVNTAEERLRKKLGQIPPSEAKKIIGIFKNLLSGESED